MAIQYQENIKIAAPAPLDKRYLSSRTLSGAQVPYSACTEVNSTIISSERYTGLTVNILGKEYWYKNGVLDANLIEKIYDTTIPQTDFITGATNLGFFSGYTGIQTLPIDNLVDNNYDGNYVSLYNNYYRGIDGIIHVGESSVDNISRRGYYNSIKNKSWIWNEYLGSTNLRGWIFIDGNIENQLGTFQIGNMYYTGVGISKPYTGDTWIQGNAYNNGSNAVINTVIGNITSGNTITIGGPVYNYSEDNHMHFRTLKSSTPQYINIGFDESFVYLSGATSIINVENIGSGVGIYAQKTGSTLQLRSIIGSGYTIVTQVGDNIVINTSTGGTGGGSITGGTNGLTTSVPNIKLGGTIDESVIFTDNRLIKTGLEYGGNYGAYFTSHSLVDKAYVDAIASGLKTKDAVDLATIGAGNNINLTSFISGSTIDGIVVLNGWRVLIKNQTNAVQNGIYTYSGSMARFYRAADFDGTPNGEVVQGNYVYVLKGNTNLGSGWVLQTPDPISIDTTPLTFGLFNKFNYISGGTGILINTLGSYQEVSIDGASLVGNSMYWSGNTFNVDPTTGTLGTVLEGKLNESAFETFVNVTLPDEYYDKIEIDTMISGDTYNLSSPAAIEVGGISVGTVLTGKTAFQLFEELLVPELCGTISAPSILVNLSANSTYEVGCVVLQTVCGTFDRGCINPQYCSISDKRSGLPNAYCFYGTGMPSGFQVCNSLVACQNNPNYTIIAGTQTWGVCARFDAGSPALSNKGNQYCAALNSGCTSPNTSSVVGIYPYYFGKLTCAIRPSVTNDLVTGGTKCLASSTSTVTIDFDSASNEYTWLAIPSVSTSKICWYVNALDNGKINNSPSDKYPDECEISVSSGQGCWTNINYKVYMSGTVGAITDPIQFRNS